MSKALWRATSKFGKSVRLTPNVWFDKILVEHPEFSASDEYLNEPRKAVENPEYIVEGGKVNILRCVGVKMRLRAQNICV